MDGDRLAERDAQIWADYVKGKTQRELAEEHGIGQQRISQIIDQVRTDIPQETKEAIVVREAELLTSIRRDVVELIGEARTEGAHRVFLDGIDRLVRLSERHARLLGLDAASKVDIGMTEETEATARLAADAARRLAGED